MTLEQILDYANVLSEEAFDSLADIIEYINEAQDLIAKWDMIQATPVEIPLTSNVVPLPTDFMKLHKATIDDIPYNFPEEPWAGQVTLETERTEGVLKIWYYKKPTVLSASTPSQIPEIKSDYHRVLAVYATKMFHLVDDDQGLKEAFQQEFIMSLTGNKVSTGMATKYKNY